MIEERTLLKDNQGFNKLVQDTASKLSAIKTLLENPKKIVSLFNSSSVEDVEMLFQDKCSPFIHKKFVNEIKSSMTEEEFLEAYTLHMGDSKGGRGGLGVFPFLTVAKSGLLKQ